MRQASQFLFVGCLTLAALTTGCGGGAAPVTSTVPKVTISWPDTTRMVEAPKLARFARITFKKLGSAEVLSSWVVARPATSSLVNTTYDSPAIPSGTTDAALEVNFFAVNPSENEPVLATAGTQVAIKPDGTLQLPNGAPLGSITHNLKVDEIYFQIPFDVYVGPSYSVLVRAFNRANPEQIIAIASDSVSYEVTTGSDKVTVSGNSFTGVAHGPFTLKVSADRFSSSTFRIMNPEIVPVTKFKMNNAQVVSNPVSGKLYATFHDPSNGNANSFAEIDPGTGGLSHVIAPFNAGKLVVSKDGTKAWGFSATGVQSVDLNTFTVSGPISLTGPAGEAMTVLSLDVNPTNANEIAVCGRYNPSGSQSWEQVFAGPVIVRNGVQLANYATSPSSDDGNQFVTYISATQVVGHTNIYAGSLNFNPMNRFSKFDINNSGTTVVSSSSVQTTGKSHFKSGSLFTHNKVINANTLATTVTLDNGQTFVSDESNGFIWNVNFYNQVIGIECFDAAQGTSRSIKCSPTYGASGEISAARISNNRMAIAFNEDLFIVDAVPGL